jgi:predicted acyl esterase
MTFGEPRVDLSINGGSGHVCRVFATHGEPLMVVIWSRGFALSRADEDAALPTALEVLRFVHVPMRDGVHLSTTAFLSRSRQVSLPVILTLPPYLPTARNCAEAVHFTRSGYVYVVLDTRGCGDSQGECEPFETDGADGDRGHVHRTRARSE